MEDKNRRIKISISVPAWLAVFIQDQAKRNEQTVSDYVKDAILEKELLQEEK